MIPRSFEWPLTPLAENLWTASFPIRFAGAWFPHVMTLIRLPDRSLVLHSPCRISKDIIADIAEVGVVKHIVAPNWFHDLYLREYRAAYPQATFWGPQFLQRLKGRALIDRVLEGPTPWQDVMEYYTVRGFLTFDESMFFHRETATLIVADLLMNIAVSHDLPFLTRLAFRLTGAHDRLCVFPLLRFAVTDTRSLRKAAMQMIAWEPQNIIVAHGSPIRDVARPQLYAALSRLLPKDA